MVVVVVVVAVVVVVSTEATTPLYLAGLPKALKRCEPVEALGAWSLFLGSPQTLYSEAYTCT